MSIHKNNILFSYLQLPKCNIKKIISDIKKVPDDDWFYDPYRKTNMLTLYSQGGGTSGKDTVMGKTPHGEKHTNTDVFEFIKNDYKLLKKKG